jgi:hypothetical protein
VCLRYKQYRSNIPKTEAYNNHFSFVDEKCSRNLAVGVEEFESMVMETEWVLIWKYLEV